REVDRGELLEKLNLTISDKTLEKKLAILVNSDIIEQGVTNYDFHGVRDNIFDKVFRGVYQKEINGFDPKEISDEYKTLYRKIQGRYNKLKGEFSEYIIINKLARHAHENNELFKSFMVNLPSDFAFAEYKTVWSYKGSPLHQRDFQIDILARAKNNEAYSLIGEVKNRKTKFSVKEAASFLEKAEELEKLEGVDNAVLFVFSSGGFYKNTTKLLKKNGVAWSEDSRWLDQEVRA
ncbi:MAG: hypothetical protein GY859_30510, partial [Desulfobacterales bacterium]|nr:hypothetical protein [Desulfobacterales bacterium]